MEAIDEKIKSYVLENFYDESEGTLNNETPLISSGILDSISVLEVVDFLENTFKIEFQPHEVDHNILNTISLMKKFIELKRT